MKNLRAPSKLSSIKTAQKESVIMRIISPLFEEVVRDRPELNGWYLNRVQLSPGKTVAYIYLYSSQPDASTAFGAALDIIKLYKPSMRKALADELQKKYTPDIVFVFDEQLEHTLRMERLLDSVKQEVE